MLLSLAVLHWSWCSSYVLGYLYSEGENWAPTDCYSDLHCKFWITITSSYSNSLVTRPRLPIPNLTGSYCCSVRIFGANQHHGFNLEKMSFSFSIQRSRTGHVRTDPSSCSIVQSVDRFVMLSLGKKNVWDLEKQKNKCISMENHSYSTPNPVSLTHSKVTSTMCH